MKVKVTQFLPLVTQLGSFLKTGIDHYADLRSAGSEAGPEIIAFFLEEKMENWNPKVNGNALLDSDTRKAATQFLAGVPVNFTRT